jgi:P-type Ca2+ transporter type 2C
MPNGIEKNRVFYRLSVQDTLRILNTKTEGLSQEEAAKRLQFYGKNKLATGKRDPLVLKLLRQFKDLMVIILIVAGLLSIYMDDYRSATIMFLIVVINALMGFFQEYKAEMIMNSLKLLVASKAKVIRGEKEIEINSDELVPGDIVKLEEGDAVPADLRIFEEHDLSTNDFALTGESNPTRKFLHAIDGEVAVGDRNNTAFMGTTVAVGNGIGIAVRTGMETEIGRIAHLSLTTRTELSPLQQELNYLAKKITIITLLVAGILFVIALGIHFTLREAFIFAVGVASAMVPEGLPAEVSVALSLAANRLALKKAIIKKLSAVETLGATHVICTDKTGTLTKNEMTVQKLLIGNRELGVTGVGYEPKGDICDETGCLIPKKESDQYRLFFETGVFASNAKVSPPDKTHPSWYSIGDPTEAALITLGEKMGLDPVAMDKQFPEIHEFTFDAARKRMSSVRKRDGKIFVYTKGAPLSVLACCTHFWDGNKVRLITNDDREFIQRKSDEYASQALRNLGYAYRELTNYRENMKMVEAERQLIWLGQVSMIDPPREEVAAAMEMAKKAFIRVIIITGDYALTAQAIAKKIGLVDENGKGLMVVTGDELAKMTDFELLQKLIYSHLIFARTSPEDKLRIVNLIKRAGEVVAVTGDGVNDAPALKRADIGVAMGKTGTEVAKDSSEIILLDDSFATLVSAVKEGRTIFQNIKKSIFSSLTTNTGELTAVLLSLAASALLKVPLAITGLQILAIDLVGQLLPVTFLTWDPTQDAIMNQAPRNPSDHVFNRKTLWDMTWTGLIMGAIGFANFLLLFQRNGFSPWNIQDSNPLYFRATTLTYVTLVVISWVNILSKRTDETESIFSRYLWSNGRLLLSFVFSLLLVCGLVYIPVVQNFLSTAPLTLNDWLYAGLGGLLYLAVYEMVKAIGRIRKGRLAPVAEKA